MRNPLPPVPTSLLDIEVAGDLRRGTPTVRLVTAPADDVEAEPVEVGGVRITGKAGDVQTVPGDGPRWVAGLGDGEPKQYRKTGAALVRAVNAGLADDVEHGGKAFRAVQLVLPEEASGEHVTELALGLLLGGYRFKVSTEDPKPAVRTVRLVTHDRAVASHTELVERATALAAATALTRDLANTPSNVKSPAWLADTAAKVAGPRVEATIRDEQWLAEQGFGGVLAVGGGSARPPRLIELSYKPSGASGAVKHLLLVGKGITFDTGGLSIKPADGMHLMRTDMAGGAAVIAATRAIAALGLPVRVTALVPAAENHVSGSAYRPGDIVRHYGGKTTEVGNTDAEGRMVLADALAYGIKRFAPDVVVDAATLTGAMKVSLGLRTGGLFATDDALASSVVAAGARVGEAWWRMPLVEDYAENVRGEFGDVRQTPGGPGSITAALFLREFTEGLPWAHLDIAGPARSEKNYNEVVPGATGFAARTLVELAASLG
ncbi:MULTISPECIES: leucyl aminopeptidase family protein [unclassified Amycolatopsis]|uniref:leucyl aminopeptidase family protein n=1 Tax=unclassified Amycolatopsis TaxID=2618356 RepID=UPI002E132A48|nr:MULTISPECIES: M17 family metallopeptidase [unclassified Amycolatopsis]WSJ76310.1 M17 family metallopeptidase [Amycolatopsis sp. NBC_01307]WSK80084.1 M17 family metallopeptidase [Amycolatopsis sp. NBC_01286]